MKKLIEFVYQPLDSKRYSPYLLSIDVNDISSYEQVNNYLCKLKTKLGNEFYIFGTYRVIGNRIAHAETKTIKIFEDFIIRPSLSLMYKQSSLEVSNVLMDPGQLKAFIDAFNYMENLDSVYNELTEHTYQSIREVSDDFWKIER